MSEVKPAARASVSVLYRHHSGVGLEVYWLRRHAAMRFAGGFFAFPGGREDQADQAISVQGATGERAWEIAAAARELFEEAGVLVARGAPPATSALRELRTALLDGRESFAAILARLNLTLSVLDFPQAGRWVTPQWMQLRFDTQFHLVELPEGQEASFLDDESDHGEWITPKDALAAWAKGDALLHPPNLYILRVLAEVPSVERALEQFAVPPPKAAMTDVVETQQGIRFVPLRSVTLPPATHTNTYILGRGALVVVDPGSPYPEEQRRLEGVLRAYQAQGFKILGVFLTHHHADHHAGARSLIENFGLPLFAHRETAARIDLPVQRHFVENDYLDTGELRFRVLHTPGHAPGHLSLLDEERKALIAGDMIAGVGTIMIHPEEGDMQRYEAELARLIPLVRVLYPAHGPPIPNGPKKLADYLAHRQWRERLILTSLQGMSQPATVSELTALAYADAPTSAWPIAEFNLRSTLKKLEAHGTVQQVDGRWSARR